MAVSVLNNIASLAAQNQLTITNANLQKALFQLSSGSRINTGADDAAGLAIADGLHANITALTQSARNANDGVGELQVADGSLAAVTTLLNRAVTIATEAATGTVSDPQRVALDDEYTAIKAEIDRVGSKTNYNGGQVFTANTLNVFLSDGGAASNSVIGVSTSVLSSNGLGLGGPVSATGTLTQAAGTAAIAATSTLNAGTIVGANFGTDTLTATSNFTGAVAATGTLTATGASSIAAGDTALVIGTSTYRFVALGTAAAAGDVALGVNQTATLQNLKDAINGTGVAGAGTYIASAVAQTQVFAGAVTGTTLVINSLSNNGVTGNTYATTGGTGGNEAFGAATLGSGAVGDTVTFSGAASGNKTYTFVAALSHSVAAQANEVLVGTQATSLTHLKEAINGTPSGLGSDFGSGTTANANFTASDGTPGSSLVFNAVANGVAGNSNAVAVSAHGTVANANFTGGAAGTSVQIGTTTYNFVHQLSATATANEVVAGTTLQSLTNLAAAVNLASNGGTYGTPTQANTLAQATVGGNNTSILFNAITPGAAGNQITATVSAQGTGGSGTTIGTFANGAAAIAAPVAAAGNSVTVGTQTYNFVNSLSATPTANEVVVGNSEIVSLANLAAAVNGGAGAGSVYGSITPTNTSARATAGATSVTFTALTGGVNGNTIATSEVGAANTFGGTTFSGGTVGSANDLLTSTDATSALATINSSIQTVAGLRGTIGATVNRLQSAAGVITNQVQNLTGAEDGVRAADIPATVAVLAKYSILEQTGISALAQANQQQQLVLKLLQ
jgi:flagellin